MLLLVGVAISVAGSTSDGTKEALDGTSRELL
jgi:hypothetical protein